MIHKTPDDMDPKTTERALVKRSTEIGCWHVQGIELTSSIRDTRMHLTIFDFDQNGNFLSYRIIESMKDNVTHQFVER